MVGKFYPLFFFFFLFFFPFFLFLFFGFVCMLVSHKSTVWLGIECTFIDSFIVGMQNARIASHYWSRGGFALWVLFPQGNDQGRTCWSATADNYDWRRRNRDRFQFTSKTNLTGWEHLIYILQTRSNSELPLRPASNSSFSQLNWSAAGNAKSDSAATTASVAGVIAASIAAVIHYLTLLYYLIREIKNVAEH